MIYISAHPVRTRNGVDEKYCPACNAHHPVTSFPREVRGDDEMYLEPTCHAGRRRTGTALNKKVANNAAYMHKYGITIEEYEVWVESQSGCCAICGLHESSFPELKRDRPLGVDHDHVTGDIRGLLCTYCNVALGYFRDDTDRLYAAIRYLQNGGGMQADIGQVPGYKSSKGRYLWDSEST